MQEIKNFNEPYDFNNIIYYKPTLNKFNNYVSKINNKLVKITPILTVYKNNKNKIQFVLNDEHSYFSFLKDLYYYNTEYIFNNSKVWFNKNINKNNLKNKHKKFWKIKNNNIIVQFKIKTNNKNILLLNKNDNVSIKLILNNIEFINNNIVTNLFINDINEQKELIKYSLFFDNITTENKNTEPITNNKNTTPDTCIVTDISNSLLQQILVIPLLQQILVVQVWQQILVVLW